MRSAQHPENEKRKQTLKDEKDRPQDCCGSVRDVLIAGGSVDVLCQHTASDRVPFGTCPLTSTRTPSMDSAQALQIETHPVASFIATTRVCERSSPDSQKFRRPRWHKRTD